MAERRESVRLELHDGGFSTQMLKNAAATGLLEKALKSLDGTNVTIHERISESAVQMDRLSSSSRDADTSINQLTGRLRVLAEVAAILGPTLGPIGAVGIAGIAGLANQMGVAAVAGGVLLGSLQGVGDALGAMNKAQLDPTNKNLEAAEEALLRLSPAAQKFAEAAFDLKPALIAIRDMGAEALMPGLTESLDNLERLGPSVANIFQTIAGTAGDLAADITGSFASDRWAGFFEFIEREAPDAITELASTVGSLTHGMAELWEAFTPLNDGFSTWIMGVADGFDQWATGLSATEGFAEFVDYIQTTGPQLADTLGAIANAVVQIVQATAPLATPVLAGLEAAADAIGAIADSDLGTPIMAGVAALSLLNRSLAVTASLSKASLSGGLFAGLGTAAEGAKKGAGSIKGLSGDLAVLGTNFATAGAKSERMAAQNAKALGNLKETGAVAGKAAGALGGLALVSSGAADGLGLTNTMSLALMGSLAGPAGIAIGAGAGALLDMKSAGEGATEAIRGLDAAIQSGDTGALTDQIAAAKAELADITNLDFGGDIFDRIGFQIADTFGGPSMDEAREKIEASERALADLVQQEKLAEVRAKGAALAFLQQTGANVDLAKWSGKTKEQIKAQADAIIESQEAAQKTAESFVTLGDSLNDGKVSLGDWIREMRDSAIALENFTANSRKAAKRGLDEGLVSSLQNAGVEGARRMRQLANGSKESIDQANAAFKRGEKAIESYNDYKVPPKKVTADTSRAMQSFREVDTYLSSLDGRTATTYVNTVRTVTGPQGAAVFSQQAYGDVKDKHNPEIAPGGAWRVWAEPETGGESYIPHANDGRRPRAKRILEETASILGARSVEWFASGGTRDDDKKKRKPPKLSLEQEGEGTIHEGPALQMQVQASQAAYAAALTQQDAAFAQAYAAQQQVDATETALLAAQDQVEAAEEQARAAEDNLRSAEQTLEATQQLRDSIAQSVSSQFTGSLTGGGLSGLTQTLDRDINAGSSMDATLQALIAAGLDTTGPGAGLLAELAASEDQRTANELLAAGPEYIAMLEQKYIERAEINTSRGATVADAMYAEQIAADTAAVAAAQQQVALMQAAQAAAEARATALQGQLQSMESQLDFANNQLDAQRQATENLAGAFEAAVNSVVTPGRR